MSKLFQNIVLVSCLFTMQMHALPLFAASRGLTVVSKEGKSIDLYKDYHAVVIGVSDYDHWPDLPNAVKDAQEVRTQLEKMGFTAELHLNSNAENLNSILANISFTLGRNEKDRALLFYFAGHGETTELANKTPLGYIIPKDCPRQDEDPEGFYKKAISMQKIQEVASLVKSKHMLMIFDSCFSGSLFKLNRSPAPAYITEKIARPVRQFITAGEAHEAVPDMSIFKKCLIKALEGDADYQKDGYITGSELGMYLQNKVVEYTQKQQHPQFRTINDPDLDEGDFVFKLPGFEETAPKPGEEDKRFDMVANEREQEKGKWDEWQDAMDARYRKNQELDKGSNLTVSEKAQMWGQFLANYATNNPYSTVDDKMRDDAKGRAEYWKGQHSKPKTPEGPVTKTETAKTTPKRQIHDVQLPAIEKIYEENGVQKEVDISFPAGYKIMPGSKGSVYFRDEENEECVIADIMVVNIREDGIAHATITGRSASILIKKRHFVKFSPPSQVADTVAPTGSIRINKDNALTNSRIATLHLSATDNIGVTGYRISTSSTTPFSHSDGWQSVTFSTNYTEDISYTLSPEDGYKTVYVWYRDAAGNISNMVEDSIELDTTPPSVTIKNPTSDTTYTIAYETISISGVASDRNGINSLVWHNNRGGGGLTKYTGNWSFPEIKLQPGRNEIIVTATDRACNKSADTIIVTYKDEPTTQSFDSKKIVATVNGRDITKQEFYNLLVDTYGEDALDVLTRRTLIYQAAEKEGIGVAATEVNQKLKTLVNAEIEALMRSYRIKDRADLEKKLLKVNSSITEIEKKLSKKMQNQAEVELLAEKVMSKREKIKTNQSYKERLGPWMITLIENASIIKQSYDSKNIVATVNGQEITKQELYNLMVDTFGEDALDVHIRRTLIYQAAEKEGISAAAGEVNQKLKTLVNAEIETLMRSYRTKDRADLEKELLKVNSSITELEKKLSKKMQKQAEVEILAEKVMSKREKIKTNQSYKERLGPWLISLIENASITKNLDND